MTLYELMMTDGHAPDEVCSLGLYKSEIEAEEAKTVAAREYSDHMLFEIVTKEFKGAVK